MNILITGDKGLIGSELKKRLIGEGHNIVRGLDIRSGEDVRDINDLGIEGDIDMVIHCAAHCKINQAIKYPELPHLNDSDGTFQVLEFCRERGIKKFVFFSSSRILSKEKNPYTAAKIYGEELCKGYKDCYGIDYIIIRPSTVYGPFWDKTNRLIHIFINNALENKDLEVLGNPETKTLDFTHVKDFVEGVMLAINNPEWNKEYNISGEEEFKVYDLARFIIDKTKSSSKIIVRGQEIAQPQQVRVDLSEIKSLGYSPKIPLLGGVEETINWYQGFLKKEIPMETKF